MPVYFRKGGQASITPPTLADLSSDEDDYITDPEQWWDSLPQPYRLVAKLVNGMTDDAWTEISARDAIREADREREIPDKCDQPEMIKNINKVTALNETSDGLYIFVGRKDGVSAVNADTMESVDCWDDDLLDIAYMHTTVFAPQTYIVATIDDIGIGRLLAFAGERFYLLKTMNDAEGDKKLIAAKLDVSSDGEFCGVTLENTTTKETWLEVHKLPCEQWVRELETVGTAKLSTSRTNMSIDSEAQGSVQSGAQKSAGENAETDERAGHKFSPAALVLKCRPPSKLTASNASSLTQLTKSVDISGDVVGMGTVHMLTQNHLSQRNAIFERMHENMLQYLPKEEESVTVCMPTIHFLTNGRFPPLILEQQSTHNAAVCVWWTGMHQLCFYSLLKQGKGGDVEIRPDVVWTFDSPITASAISPCSALLGIGLQTGNALVYDKHSGISRRVVRVCDGPIACLDFINPSVLISPKTTNGYRAYAGPGPAKVLVMDRAWSCYLVDCTQGEKDQNPQVVYSSDKAGSDKPIWIQYMKSHPHMVLRVSRQGIVTLQDIIQGRDICRLLLPHPFSVAQPWQPVTTAAGNGQILCIKGTAPSEESEGDEESFQETVFYFLLKRVKCLNPYLTCPREETPCFIHVTAEERADALLATRSASHSERQAKLKRHWSSLKDTCKRLEKQQAAAC